MTSNARGPSPSHTARFWIAVGVIAIGTFTSGVLSRTLPVTAPTMGAVALLGAACTLAVAWLTARFTPYARWAHWTSAALLAAWVAASSWFAPDPRSWRSEVWADTWLVPWFVLTWATVARRGARGVCATEGRRAGWIMVTASLVFGGILAFAERIGRML